MSAQDRAEGTIQAMLWLIGVVFVVIFGTFYVAAPIVEAFMDVARDTEPLVNASWIDFSLLETIALNVPLLALPLLIIILAIVWVFAWYIRRQIAVRRF